MLALTQGLMSLAASGGGGGSFASLLHFDGANGSTSFPDVAGNTWTRTGTPAISTAQSVFGGASMEISSTGENRIDTTSSLLNFGTGDFCIEGRFRPNANTNRAFFSFTDGASLNLLVYTASGQWAVFYTGTNVMLGGIATANVWHHVVLNRYLSVMNLFINGTRVANFGGAGSGAALNPGRLRYGWFNSGNPGGGFYDECRVTPNNSVYQNVASFTVPTSPFPDA